MMTLFSARPCSLLMLAGLSLGFGTLSARASSDDSWAAFGKEVAAACKAATGDSFSKPRVVVDPYGSERFGLAIVTGKLKAGGTGSVICVFDKQSRKAEVGSELGPDLLKIAK